MLIHQGKERSLVLDRRLAYSLAFIAGALNSAGFYALGFFAGNMTGNISAGADKLALGDMLSGAIYLLLPITFIAGAALATLLVNIGLRWDVRRIYAFSILSEAVMLALLGMIDLRYHNRGTVLIFGLSGLLGFQNAVVTLISNWRVRTTHISGMSTDIGIGIGMLLGSQARVARAEQFERLRLHGVTVLLFCLGGIGGVVAYKVMGGGLLVIAAVLMAAIAIPNVFNRSTKGTLQASPENASGLPRPNASDSGTSHAEAKICR